MPQDIIAFPCALSKSMLTALVSHASVQELLQILKMIESTLFENLPNTWRFRTSRMTDYNPGRTDPYKEFVFSVLRCRDNSTNASQTGAFVRHFTFPMSANQLGPC